MAYPPLNHDLIELKNVTKTYIFSDHKPVAALLELGVNTKVAPMVEFTLPHFHWVKGEKLVVSFKIGKGVSYITILNTTVYFTNLNTQFE